MNLTTRRNLKLHGIWLPTLAPALALSAMLAGCGRKSDPLSTSAGSLPLAQVQVQRVESKPRPMTEEVVGTVRTKLRATLEAKVTGRIRSMPVLLGQLVEPGELIARLDAPEIEARLEQARATLDQAERDWKRISSLYESQTTTKSEYDAADARRGVAKAALAEAQAMLSYVEITAPFKGVVAKKWADVGDLATPGKPLIEIEDPSALQLEADVPEAIASHLQRDNQLVVRLDSLKGDLVGTVKELAPAADPTSRTVRVKLDLPSLPTDSAATGAPHVLMSGQFARLIVPIGTSTSLRVPASAVIQRGQLEIAFVAANQRAQLHLVKTGKRLGAEVEILSGLDAGDRVVIEGADQLRDGQPVEAK